MLLDPKVKVKIVKTFNSVTIDLDITLSDTIKHNIILKYLKAKAVTANVTAFVF